MNINPKDLNISALNFWYSIILMNNLFKSWRDLKGVKSPLETYLERGVAKAKGQKMDKLSSTDDKYYEQNLAFWEKAWSRVKNLYKKPNEVDYLEEMPRVLKEHSAQKVLDIACGSGWLSVYLNSHGFNTTGIDVSESAIKLAWQWVEEDKLENIDFKVLDMMQVDSLPEASFDAVMINSTFEHLNYELGLEFFKKLKKVIKPGGLLFGAFDEVCRGEKGEFETLRDGSRVYSDEARAGMLLRNFSDEELEELLKSSNWEIISKRINEQGTRVIWAKN